MDARKEQKSSLVAFKEKVGKLVVAELGPYRKDGVKVGRITSHEDFKYLARKVGRDLPPRGPSARSHHGLSSGLGLQITRIIIEKEKKAKTDLEYSSSVKHKAREFVKSFMAKCGPV